MIFKLIIMRFFRKEKMILSADIFYFRVLVNLFYWEFFIYSTKETCFKVIFNFKLKIYSMPIIFIQYADLEKEVLGMYFLRPKRHHLLRSMQSNVYRKKKWLRIQSLKSIFFKKSIQWQVWIIPILSNCIRHFNVIFIFYSRGWLVLFSHGVLWYGKSL